MSLANPIRQDVEHALREMGLGRRIRASVPVGSGCINNGLRIDTEEATPDGAEGSADP